MGSPRSPFLYSFHSPYNNSETVKSFLNGVIFSTADDYGRQTVDYLDTPPREACIYFSTVRDDKVVVTAGNRVETYWQLITTFKPSDEGGIYGEMNLDRAKRDVKMWIGNITTLQVKLPGYLYRRASMKMIGLDDKWFGLFG